MLTNQLTQTYLLAFFFSSSTWFTNDELPGLASWPATSLPVTMVIAFHRALAARARSIEVHVTRRRGRKPALEAAQMKLLPAALIPPLRAGMPTAVLSYPRPYLGHFHET